jgi:hypothetical protein
MSPSSPKKVSIDWGFRNLFSGAAGTLLSRVSETPRPQADDDYSTYFNLVVEESMDFEFFCSEID